MLLKIGLLRLQGRDLILKLVVFIFLVKVALLHVLLGSTYVSALELGLANLLDDITGKVVSDV